MCIRDRELIEPNNTLYREYKRGEFSDGPLKFRKWPDSKGVAITTGMLRHEFVKALSSHLIGMSSRDYTDNGKLDRIAAETILEEMYDDSQTKPAIVEPAAVR